MFDMRSYVQSSTSELEAECQLHHAISSELSFGVLGLALTAHTVVFSEIFVGLGLCELGSVWISILPHDRAGATPPLEPVIQCRDLGSAVLERDRIQRPPLRAPAPNPRLEVPRRLAHVPPAPRALDNYASHTWKTLELPCRDGEGAGGRVRAVEREHVHTVEERIGRAHDARRKEGHAGDVAALICVISGCESDTRGPLLAVA
jgi:hypothetical protein